MPTGYRLHRWYLITRNMVPSAAWTAWRQSWRSRPRSTACWAQPGRWARPPSPRPSSRPPARRHAGAPPSAPRRRPSGPRPAPRLAPRQAQWQAPRGAARAARRPVGRGQRRPVKKPLIKAGEEVDAGGKSSYIRRTQSEKVHARCRAPGRRGGRRVGVYRVRCPARSRRGDFSKAPARAGKGVAAVARIAGVNIPTNKRVVIALQYIHGIGAKKAQEIMDKIHLPQERRVSQLTDQEVLQIREVIDRDYIVEGDLRREVQLNIKRLQDLGCYRGLRHRRNLPVRGQRTHTNARTRKGPAKAIAGKKRAT